MKTNGHWHHGAGENPNGASQATSSPTGLAGALNVTLPAPRARTDADIARSAEDLLAWSSAVPRDAVHVAVVQGHVTLTGTVDWDYQRLAVVASIRYLSGVTAVSNRIAIRPSPLATSMVPTPR